MDLIIYSLNLQYVRYYVEASYNMVEQDMGLASKDHKIETPALSLRKYCMYIDGRPFRIWKFRLNHTCIKNCLA